MGIMAARYFPRTNDPQQMVMYAAKEFYSDTGRYPTHAAISRLYWPAWGSSQLILCNPERDHEANDEAVERSTIQVAYRDDVMYGWVRCVYQPPTRVSVV